MREIAWRHRWAVELLAPQAGERVLEIGAGHGIATGLLIDAGASVVAIDRSAKMVDASRKRNPSADIREGEFEAMELGDFDAVVAINVDFALHDDKGWATRLYAVLKPGGRAVLVLEAPGPRPAERFALLAATRLVGAGFRVETIGEAGRVAVRARRIP